MTALDAVFLAFGLLFVAVLFFGLFWHFFQASKDRAVKREKSLRFYPDENGNYPQDHFLLERGIYLQGGNFASANQPTYIIQPQKSEVVLALPKEPGPALSVLGQPLKSPSMEVTEITSQPQKFTSQEEVIGYLTTCKQEGMTQTAALKTLGITGGETFKKMAALWKSLT